MIIVEVHLLSDNGCGINAGKCCKNYFYGPGINSTVIYVIQA
jgi:hypothetical protein